MSQDQKQDSTKEYSFMGHRYSVSAEAQAFLTALTATGQSEEAALGVLFMAVKSGIVKGVKELRPDVVAEANQVLVKASKANKALVKARSAMLDAQIAMDDLTDKAGCGRGWEYGGTSAGRTSLGRDIRENEFGLISESLRVKEDSAIAKAALAVTESRRVFSATVYSIVDQVAKNLQADTPKVKVTVDETGLVQVKGGAARKATSSGTGKTGGKRSKYDISTDGGTITIKLGDDVLAQGSTGDELVKALKETLPAHDKVFYLSQWNRQSWWPK